MADKKISALTSATTPLAGTEVLPIVQSGSTVKVPVADLTVGRNTSMKNAAVGTTLANWGSVVNVVQVGNGTADGALVGLAGDDTELVTNAYWNSGYKYQTTGTAATRYYQSGGTHVWQTASSGTAGNAISFTNVLTLSATANVTFNTGNLVQGTATKGINFTANTPAAGMTSQLLNWYEEGTWTPNQGAGLTLVGAFSSAGTYTRIGRQVFIRGSVSGATSVAVASAGAITTNLPYSAAADATGTAINAANNASSILRVSSATLTAATAIAATTTITFSAVYSV